MKYTIISLNDDRKEYFDILRRTVDLEEVYRPAFNAYTSDVKKALEIRGIEWHGDIWGNPKIGELGVWISNYDRWEFASKMHEPLIVFEDDAIADPFFNEKFAQFYDELPEDWDFAALWVPENQRQDFLYDVRYEQGIPRINGILPADQSLFRIPGKAYAALVYQGYGMVSLMYSPVGAQKLVQLVKEHGITGPVDCWIYEHAHMGNLNGYAPRPEQASIVHYDWKAVSHVQLTERVT